MGGDGDGDGGPEAPDEIKVGAVVPLSGELASWGEYLDYGYQYIIDKVNDNGGIYVEEYDQKIQIEYVRYDDESTPERSTSLVERLATQDKVVAILGSGTPLLGAPTASAGERMGVPTLHCSTPLEVMQQNIDPEDREWSWDLFFSLSDEKFGFLTSIFRALEYYNVESNKKVVSFCDKTPDGNASRDIYNMLADEYGYEIVYEPELDTGKSEFGTEISEAMDLDADILVGMMLPSDGWSMWRQVQSYGWRPKFASVKKTAEPSEWWNELGEVGEYVCHGGYWHPSMPWPGTQDLANAYEEDKGEMWSLHIADAAAITQVLVNAIEEAGNLERADINEAIGETDMMTVAGPVNYELEGQRNHQSVLPCGLFQWVDGDRKMVWYPPKSDTGTEYASQEEIIQEDLVYPIE